MAVHLPWQAGKHKSRKKDTPLGGTKIKSDEKKNEGRTGSLVYEHPCLTGGK